MGTNPITIEEFKAEICPKCDESDCKNGNGDIDDDTIKECIKNWD